MHTNVCIIFSSFPSETYECMNEKEKKCLLPHSSLHTHPSGLHVQHEIISEHTDHIGIEYIRLNYTSEDED